jgi:hypothetical protein
MTPATTPSDVPPAIAAAGPEARAAWDDLTRGEDFRASTRDAYRGAALRFLRWLEPQGVGLALVSPRLVERFLDEQDLAPKSKVTYRTGVRRFFDALVARNALPSNPADEAELSVERLEAAAAATPPEETAAEAWPASSEGSHPGRPTLAELKGYVRELALDPIEEDDEDFAAALVLVAALYLGSRDLEGLSRLTEIPLPLIEQFAGRLRANGVWTADGITSAAWLSDDGGNLAFWMDVWVATGMMERCPAGDGTNPASRARLTPAPAPRQPTSQPRSTRP